MIQSTPRSVLIGAALGALLVGCGTSSGNTDPEDTGVREDTGGVDVANDTTSGVDTTPAEDTTVDTAVEDTGPEPIELDYICTSNRVSRTDPYLDQIDGFGYEATFEIPDGAYSFELVSIYDPGDTHVFMEMDTPDGRTLDFLTYAYQMFHSSLQLTGMEVDALLLPPSPNYADYVMGGTYTLRGVSSVGYGEFCFRVLVNEDPGTEIDINFYLVEGSGLTAATALDNPDWVEVLFELEETYAEIGVTVNIETAQYFDITGAAATEHRVIDSQAEISELFMLSEDPEIDPLRLNVFLVEGFGSSMRGVLGVSGGIPGTPGLHGGPASGVVFGTEGLLGGGDFLNNYNVLLGQTMAHEIGHYLGLFHTTELYGGISDDLADTPVCPADTIQDYRAMASCPDYANLMFPTASLRSSVDVTDQQSEVLRGQPNVQPR